MSEAKNAPDFDGFKKFVTGGPGDYTPESVALHFGVEAAEMKREVDSFTEMAYWQGRADMARIFRIVFATKASARQDDARLVLSSASRIMPEGEREALGAILEESRREMMDEFLSTPAYGVGEDDLTLESPASSYDITSSIEQRKRAAIERRRSIEVTKHPSGDVEKVFQALAEEWREAIEFTFSFTDMVLHPAYQKIIGLGPVVVPALLRELQRSPDHWFWALAHITRENPIRDEDAGNLDRMTEAWLEWGEQHGHL